MRQTRPAVQQQVRATLNGRPITGQQPMGVPNPQMSRLGTGVPAAPQQPRAGYKYTSNMRNPPSQGMPSAPQMPQVRETAVGIDFWDCVESL